MYRQLDTGSPSMFAYIYMCRYIYIYTERGFDIGSPSTHMCIHLDRQIATWIDTGSLSIYICIYVDRYWISQHVCRLILVYIYIYIHIYIFISHRYIYIYYWVPQHMYIYIHMWRGRQIDRQIKGCWITQLNIYIYIL